MGEGAGQGLFWTDAAHLQTPCFPLDQPCRVKHNPIRWLGLIWPCNSDRRRCTCRSPIAPSAATCLASKTDVSTGAGKLQPLVVHLPCSCSDAAGEPHCSRTVHTTPAALRHHCRTRGPPGYRIHRVRKHTLVIVLGGNKDEELPGE